MSFSSRAKRECQKYVPQVDSLLHYQVYTAFDKQQKSMVQVNDSYLKDYMFSTSGKDILVLIVASLTPAWDNSTNQPVDDQGYYFYEGGPFPNLTNEGLRNVGRNMNALMCGLTKPFSDDDCAYAGEYVEGEMSFPLRFVEPKTGEETLGFKWLPAGGEPGEEEHGVLFIDKKDCDYKTAFFITLQKGSGLSSLYWSHVAPYLSSLEKVYIAGYSDQATGIIVGEYCDGTEVARWDSKASGEWIRKSLILSPNEFLALNQELACESEIQDSNAAETGGSSSEILRHECICDESGVEVELKDHTEFFASMKNMQKWTLAETASTSISQLVHLARFDEYRMSKEAARKTLAEMATSFCTLSELRTKLATDGQLIPDAISTLAMLIMAFSSDEEIREIIAQQKSAPLSIIQILCEDEKGGIRFAARANRDGVVSWEV